MTPFLTIFTYVASFSMLMLYTNDFNYINYFSLQFATIIFGREFEALVKNDFSLGDEEEEETSNLGEKKPLISWENFLSLPVFFFLHDEVETENSYDRHLTKLGKMMRFYRNELCTVVFFGSLIFHYLENAYPPPELLPDLYRVLNNVLCLGFFTLMLVYAHLMMQEEAAIYIRLEERGSSKKVAKSEIASFMQKEKGFAPTQTSLKPKKSKQESKSRKQK